MSKSNKHPFVVEVERAFGVLNARLFKGRLRRPTVVIDAKRKVVVRYISDMLVVGSEIKNVDAHDFLAKLLHEMVHVDNAQNGILDCTNHYHNQKFLAAALHVGLVVISGRPSLGWGETKTGIPRGLDPQQYRLPEAAAVNRRVKAFEEVKLDRNLLKQTKAEIADSHKPVKPYFLKYVCKCPPPHNSIRSGRRPDGQAPLRIVCEQCGARFVLDKSSGG